MSKVPAKQRGKLAKNVLNSKEQERATFFSPSDNRCLPASTLKPEERESVVESGASMHMISKKDLNDAEMDTLTKSCSPTIVISANGEVQTHEEATAYVKELDIFLTMKVLENTPAVLSLGKLCDENGYSYEWIGGKKPHLSDTMQHGELRSYRGSRLVNEFFVRFSSFNFNDTFKAGRLLHRQQHQVIMRLEKERTELKVIPLQCLCQFPMLMIERGNPLWTKPTKNNFQKEIKKETKIERGNPLSADSSRASSEIPEWLQEFRENFGG